VTLWVDWDRQPVSVHAQEAAILERLILHLRNQHNVRKRSIVMADRENDGFLFFIYQVCDPRWIASFLDQSFEEGA
jgi:hypothetical protein